jgi:hypothetical protein
MTATADSLRSTTPPRQPWIGRLTRWAARALMVVAVCTATGLAPNAFDWYGPVTAHPWYLSAVHLDRRVTGTGAGVRVAVIDTGVDTGRPDLRGHVLPVACVDTGCAQQRHGDPIGHGTMVASIIVGQGAKDQVAGVAPGATVLPVKIGTDDQRELADAIRYAATRASVINLSLGPPEAPQPQLVDAVRFAQQHDAVVVAATGNLSGTSQVVTPANIPGVVAVTGTSPGDRPYDDAVNGPQVVLAAPAELIVGANTRTGLESIERWPVPAAEHIGGSGTSYSTPIVAGIAALVRSRYPHLDAGNVIQRLITTAHNPTTGRTTTFGYGIVDADRAVTAHVAAVASNPLAHARPALYATPPVKSSDQRLTKLYLGVWLSEGAMSLLPPNPLIWLVVRGAPSLATTVAVVLIPILWRRLRRPPTRRAAGVPTGQRGVSLSSTQAPPPPGGVSRPCDTDAPHDPATRDSMPALPAGGAHEVTHG